MKKRKIFVLDTCVLLYDHAAYKSFGDNDIVIPIDVLEELDKFKKGNEAINYEAREIIRVIDKLSADNGLNEWVNIGEEGAGRIKISFKQDSKINAEELFNEKKPDHRILNVALSLQETESDADVVLVTKDVNLRVKAKAIGLQTEDYRTGIQKNVHRKHTGKFVLSNASDEIIDKLYEDKKLHISAFECCHGFPEDKKEIINAYFIINHENNTAKSALGWYSPKDNHMHLITKQNIANIRPRNAEQAFAIHAVLNPAIKIVTIQGKAGTGKSLMAIAGAIEQKSNFQQIYIARPIVPLNNRDLGFLPGDVDSKIAPYMEPIWDNLKFIKSQAANLKKDQKKLDDLTDKDKIVVTPLAYIRGRSLANILFIVDEAQNLSPLEVKTIITRLGENSKIIFTGDVAQIDNPFLDQNSNGVSYMIDRLKGEELYAHVTLEKGERSDVATLAAEKL